MNLTALNRSKWPVHIPTAGQFTEPQEVLRYTHF